ncbi:MAG: hypothetical protein D6759_16395, partial [Chloroflexi bacterium]
MSRDIETLLEECLLQLRAGASVEECLARYPEQAEALRPYLTLMAEIRALPRPQARPEAVRAGRERMLAALAAKKQAAPPPTLLERIGQFLGGLRPMAPAWRAAVAMLLVVVVIGGSLSVVLASESLPGDPLYPVKRASEEVQLFLAFSPATRAQLLAHFAQE